MNSLRLALCSVALGLLASPTPAAATTTLESADYSGATDVWTAGNVALGAGTYKFSLSFTQPVLGLFGFVEKTTSTDEYCDLGEGEFYCGGDDVTIQPLFTEVSPQLYQLMVTVNDPSTFTWSPEHFVVRQNNSDSCCDYQFGFLSGNAGHYVLTYSAVPEPAIWAMMLVGFGAIGFAARRRSYGAARKSVTF